MPRPDLPNGTVTLLFTDVEGSTKLLLQLGASAYADALLEHRRALRNAFSHHGGVEVDTEGDAFLVAFASAGAALAAAADGQRALAKGPIRVRMGMHTGAPYVTDEGYVGEDVHLGARIAAVGHGGQVLLSNATRMALDDTFELTDLGEHRLKDFGEPVWIYQLGGDHFAPLKSISNTNLPRPASDFIGREGEVQDLAHRVRDGARLVTLTGPGGTGKTRLSIEVASDLVPDFRNGTFWVDLAPLTDAALVPATIAQTIGARGDPADYIGQREMLLVLDNFERVVAAASPLRRLLETCPNLRILVTSRERLRINGEVEYRVPPLVSAEAVELFATRSGRHADETVSELCARLDNLPLAIELAAARASVLSPEQILERLGRRLDLLKGGRDADARQHTLRATIEWSYQLLDDDEEALFGRLGIFAGGWSLASAEEVVDADLDVLESLVDKSLVRHDGERFTMLETIRQYAVEKLEESDEVDELRRRHAEHFMQLAEQLEPVVLGLRPRPALDRLDAEHDNLRAALDWLEASDHIPRAMRLAGALWAYWSYRGHVVEGTQRLERLLDRGGGMTREHAKVLTGWAGLASMLGTDGRRQAERYQAALEIYRALDDAWGIAYVEWQDAFKDRDFVRAIPAARTAVERMQALGDQHFALRALRSLAWATLEVHGRTEAQPIYDRLLREARELGADGVAAKALNTLAAFANEDGRPLEALRLNELAYRADQADADPAELTDDLFYFAETAANAGWPDVAAQLLGAGAAGEEELSLELPMWIARKRDATERIARDQLGDVAFEEACEAGRRLSRDRAVELALRSGRERPVKASGYRGSGEVTKPEAG